MIGILELLIEGIALAVGRLAWGPWCEVFIGTFTECEETASDLLAGAVGQFP